MDVLYELPVWLAALLVVAASLLVTALFGLVMRRQQVEASSTVGAVQSTVSTIYTVLLAFVVVIVWQQFNDAATRVELEAQRLSNVVRDAGAFSDPNAASDAPCDLKSAVHEYVSRVVEGEWPEMARGVVQPDAASDAYRGIWHWAYQLEPSGPREEAFFAELLGRLNELAAARRSRLESVSAKVPPVLWWVLLIGAGILLGVSHLLPRERWSPVALAGMSSLIGLTLFLIFAFDHPFAGDLRVDPDPLMHVARTYPPCTPS